MNARFRSMLGAGRRWTYRGQILPTNRRVEVRAVVTARDDGARRLTADGWLAVDGRLIYRMDAFALEMANEGS